jgi:dTDP-4-dehydrorhamnose reductase
MGSASAMKTLILGANGQVGYELKRLLSPQGQVEALARQDADFSDAAALQHVLLRAKANVIINAAAYTAVDKAETDQAAAERINHHAVAEIAAHAKATNALLIHYSTDYVYDGTKSAPYLETDATNPVSIYGATKLRGEDAVRASGCHHIIFRTSWVYAARGGNFVKTMLRLAAARDELNVVADQYGAPTSAALIAEVTAQALAKPVLAGTYHLVAGGETTWHGFALVILAEARRLGLQLKAGPDQVRPIPTSAYPTPARRPANSRLDTNKLRTALGLALPPWEDHVRRVVGVLANESRM